MTHVGHQLRKNRLAAGKTAREVAAEAHAIESKLDTTKISTHEITGKIGVDHLRTYVRLGYLTPEQALAAPAEDAA